MKTAAYFLSLILLAPSALLAVFFALIDHATTQPSLLALLSDLLRHAYELVTWGLWLALAALGALLALGFVGRYRPWGAAVNLAIGLISLWTLISVAGLPRTMGEAAFHLPGLASMGLNLWLLGGRLRPRAAG
jgi:hypothetical protein